MGPEMEAEIVDALYRGACDEQQLRRAIQTIASAFDCPSLLLGDLDTRSPEKSSVIGAGLMDAGQIQHYTSLGQLDPGPAVFTRLKLGTAGLTYRMLDESALRRHQFYDEFLKPLSINHAMASPLHVSGTRVAMIALHQVEGRRLLDDGDAMRLERLTPHLVRVLDMRRSFKKLQERQSSYNAIIDRSTTGLIGIGRDRKALFVNAAMRALAARRDGLSLDRNGLLVLIERAASQHMGRLQADVVNGGAGGYVRVSRPSGRQPYVLSVSRLPVHDEALPPGGILLAVVDPDHRRVPSEAQIAALLDLPPGPAKVVRALMSGESLKTYAEKAGISLNTVRSHLKVAFARSDTHDQTDLVRLTLAISSEIMPLRT